MSNVEHLALRCVLPGFIGTNASDWLRRAAARGVGGVVLYSRNVADRDQLRTVTDALHAERPALLVSIDEEGGNVTRLEARTGSSYPGNLALGQIGDAGLTEEVARAIGVDLAEVGVDLDFAPVADVNTDPRNPIIGVRSFGSSPAEVARQTEAWVRGLQSAGVAACAKHFPGHGDTAVDSHIDLPVAGSDPRNGALAPFESAMAAGVRAIMSAHIVVPALDDAPATVSRKAMTGLLRDELGFEGLTISDGLDMRGISAACGIEEAAVQALVAGCDALCIGGGPADEAALDAIVAALVDAVANGRLSEERLAQAAGRVDALGQWRARQSAAPRAVDRAVGLAAARRALRCDGEVRVGERAVVARFATRSSVAAGDVPWGMAAALEARRVDVTESETDMPDRSLVVVVRDLHRVAADQRDAVGALLARRPDAVVVEMGVPVCRPQGARGYIATYGSARVCAQAAAELMTR
jgi:beta-N-acetylhexosaminidase